MTTMAPERQSNIDGKPAESGPADQRVETMDYAAMMRRMLRAWERRLSDADVEDVAEFVTFEKELRASIATVVAAMRERDVPWSAIARAFGTTKQNVEQRFGA